MRFRIAPQTDPLERLKQTLERRDVAAVSHRRPVLPYRYTLVKREWRICTV